MNETCPTPCLVCGRTLTSTQLSYNQPYGGVAIHIFGNYGSTVFDTMHDDRWLEATLCDHCLGSAIAGGRILHATRSHEDPPPIYRLATTEKISPAAC